VAAFVEVKGDALVTPHATPGSGCARHLCDRHTRRNLRPARHPGTAPSRRRADPAPSSVPSDVDPTLIRRYGGVRAHALRRPGRGAQAGHPPRGTRSRGARGSAARALRAAPGAGGRRGRRARARALHPAPADPRVPRPAARGTRLPRDPRAHDLGGRGRRGAVAHDALPQGRGPSRQRGQRLRAPPRAAAAGRVRSALHRTRSRGPLWRRRAGRIGRPAVLGAGRRRRRPGAGAAAGGRRRRERGNRARAQEPRLPPARRPDGRGRGDRDPQHLDPGAEHPRRRACRRAGARHVRLDPHVYPDSQIA
jgi:hypothetical protein